MKYCDKCNIHIKTNYDYCPLCHQTLIETKPEVVIDKYPKVKSQLRPISHLMKRIILFVSLTSIILLLTINLVEGFDTPWSLIPIGSIVFFWLFVSVGFFSYRNITAKLLLITLFSIFFIYMIDELSYSKGWSLNYVAPLLLFSCNLAISLIILIKRINYRDYISYLLLIVIFSLIPLVLILFDVVTVLWPAITSFGLAVFILLFVIFFFPKSIKDEINKRFHA